MISILNFFVTQNLLRKRLHCREIAYEGEIIITNIINCNFLVSITLDGFVTVIQQ